MRLLVPGFLLMCLPVMLLVVILFQQLMELLLVLLIEVIPLKLVLERITSGSYGSNAAGN